MNNFNTAKNQLKLPDEKNIYNGSQWFTRYEPF